jgi:hypothetical protein
MDECFNDLSKLEKALIQREGLIKALQRIVDFPYVGRQAAEQMSLIAREALYNLNGKDNG